MRTHTCCILLLPALSVGRFTEDAAYLRDTAQTSALEAASITSVLTSSSSEATGASDLASLKFHQVPDFATMEAEPAVHAHPQLNARVPQAIEPAAAVPIPADAAPVPAATNQISTTTTVNNDFITVQWVETWIGGKASGSQTWMPHTISYHFEPFQTQDPQPGKGEIGMGTLTGKTGQTHTHVLGAAPTQAVRWVRGVAAAFGVGVVGMVM